MSAYVGKVAYVRYVRFPGPSNVGFSCGHNFRMPTISGLHLSLPSRIDSATSRLSRGLWYEPTLLRAIRSRRLTGRAVDVGAHVGNHALWMGGICGLTVEAFEPAADLYRCLTGNVAANSLSGRISTYKVALGETAGMGAWDPDTPMRLVADTLGDIPIRQLDDYRFQNVALIKVDVEGAESLVLAGGRNTIREYQPIIYAEAAGIEARVDIDGVLGPLGYRLTHVVPTATPVGCWEPT